MNDLDLVRRQMASIDPVPDLPAGDRAGSPHARALLERIVVTPRSTLTIGARSGGRQEPRPTTGRWVLAGAVTTVLVLAGAIALWPGAAAPAVAATPPLLPISTTERSAGAPVLEAIAAAADALPDEPVTGPYRYVHTEGWALNSAVTDDGTTSVLASRQIQAWVRPDGTGRYRTVPGVDLVDRVGSQETLEAALGERATRDLTITPDTAQPLPDLERLDFTDPVAFALSVDPTVNAALPPDTLLIEAITNLFASQPLPPAVRAQVWRLLASTPAATYRGRVQDRAGRTGDVITREDDGSAHGLAGRDVLVINPATGQLLEADHVLTEAGKLNIDVPAVITMTVYLDHGYTDRPGGQPGR